MHPVLTNLLPVFADLAPSIELNTASCSETYILSRPIPLLPLWMVDELSKDLRTESKIGKRWQVLLQQCWMSEQVTHSNTSILNHPKLYYKCKTLKKQSAKQNIRALPSIAFIDVSTQDSMDHRMPSQFRRQTRCNLHLIGRVSVPCKLQEGVVFGLHLLQGRSKVAELTLYKIIIQDFQICDHHQYDIHRAINNMTIVQTYAVGKYHPDADFIIVSNNRL